MRLRFAAALAALGAATALSCVMEVARGSASVSPELQQRLERLEAGVAAAEDLLAIKKKLGLPMASTKEKRGRIYRIVGSGKRQSA